MAQIPYEFLARWDHTTGVLKGAHVKTYDSVTMREGDAQAVAVAGASGFPLSDVLTALEQGAVAAMESAQAALAPEQASRAQEVAAHAATKAQNDALKAVNDALKAVNDALTAEVARLVNAQQAG